MLTRIIATDRASMKSLVSSPPAPAKVSDLVAATALSLPDETNALARARAFAEPLLLGQTLDTGENMQEHADAVASILQTIGGSEAMQAASYLVYACNHLNKPYEVIAKAFGESFAELAVETTKLIQVQRQALAAQPRQVSTTQTETVRKMLLAFSRDLRVVMLRLASRLQSLRYFAASKQSMPKDMAAESLNVFAPLANRLGIWEIKWEMEDLAFRFLEPDTYKQIARQLDEKRSERETYMHELCQMIESGLQAQGIPSRVQGRPKNIYSIVKKMRGKSLSFEQLYDLRAVRIIVAGVSECYAVLSWVHTKFSTLSDEYDDYIAKPKANGYQSLHTVVRDTDGRTIEVQIRTEEMHNHAEHGVAAHWAYKEAGAKGYAGVSADSAYDLKIAVLRQLLAWERDLAAPQLAQDMLDDRVYVLTPNAAIVELPQGSTAIDFAYSVHTDLGHRCRGARVDGQMVPLNTPLKNGQTVEVVTAKEGGPSRDWLNPDLAYLASPRARSKVRAWFNALDMHETVMRGREAVEKLLQREGRTSLRLDDLAVQLGYASADALFEAVGKDEYSVRSIEHALHPPEPTPPVDEQALLKKTRPQSPGRGAVLVVGLDSLMTQLAKCCKPAPPDAISGFVTRGKGVSVHRSDCPTLRQMAERHAERLIEVQWGRPKQDDGALYPVDVRVEAAERPGLLRDVLDIFGKEKCNVVNAQTQVSRGTSWMSLTVEVSDAGRLARVLPQVAAMPGVRSARRR